MAGGSRLPRKLELATAAPALLVLFTRTTYRCIAHSLGENLKMRLKDNSTNWRTCKRCKAPVVPWAAGNKRLWTNPNMSGVFCYRDKSDKHYVFDVRDLDRPMILAQLNKLLDGNRMARSFAGNEVRGNTYQGSNP